jgi:CheY-like chemotaxis protein
VQRAPLADCTVAHIGYDPIRSTDVGCRVTTSRILLIDDDVDLLDMLKSYMEREEFAVTTANVAAEGLAAALSTDHDLAVLDVMMPQMSGIEALRRIRMTSLIPVLMLTRFAAGGSAKMVMRSASRGPPDPSAPLRPQPHRCFEETIAMTPLDPPRFGPRRRAIETPPTSHRKTRR